jgi:hypothetical protein
MGMKKKEEVRVYFDCLMMRLHPPQFKSIQRANAKPHARLKKDGDKKKVMKERKWQTKEGKGK